MSIPGSNDLSQRERQLSLISKEIMISNDEHDKNIMMTIPDRLIYHKKKDK